MPSSPLLAPRTVPAGGPAPGRPGRLSPGSGPLGVPLRHPDGPAHGGPGHHDRQRRPPAHPRGPRPLRRRALLGPERLPAHLRRPAAPGGPLRRPARTAPHLPGRHRHLLAELALRRVGRRRLDAPGRPCPPGRRRRPGRALLAGPADHHLLRRAPAGPGHRPLHDRVGRRGSHRPRGRRRADPAGVVALGDVRERADRHRRAAASGASCCRRRRAATGTSTSPAPSRRPSAWPASCSGWSRPAPAAGRASLTVGSPRRRGLPARRSSSASRPGPRSRSCRCGSSPAGRAPTANVSRGLMYAGMYGMFFFVGQFLQDVEGYSPLRTGLCFLPVPVSVFLSSQLVSKVLIRPGPAQGADHDAASASPSWPCSCRRQLHAGRRTCRSSSASSCWAWARGPRWCR